MRSIFDPVLHHGAHGALDDARAELSRALSALGRAELAATRSALGHAALHVGLVARVAWVSLVRRLADVDVERAYFWLMRVHPEVPIARLASLVKGCPCDTRDPQICSFRADEHWDDQGHTWCCCVPCHGPVVASRPTGADRPQHEGGKGGAA